MACSVRIGLRCSDRATETSALINSGFETDAQDIVVHVN